jgi:hypothetical protein
VLYHSTTLNTIKIQRIDVFVAFYECGVNLDSVYSDLFKLETHWCFARVAEAMGYLPSGHGVNPSLGPLSRRPVAQGPELRYPTPSAMCECMGQWFLMVELH